MQGIRSITSTTDDFIDVESSVSPQSFHEALHLRVQAATSWRVEGESRGMSWSCGSALDSRHLAAMINYLAGLFIYVALLGTILCPNAWLESYSNYRLEAPRLLPGTSRIIQGKQVWSCSHDRSESFPYRPQLVRGCSPTYPRPSCSRGCVGWPPESCHRRARR